MRYVSLHDVIIDMASRVDADKLTVLAETQDKSPMILASDEPGKPQWKSSSYFAKYAANPLP